MYRAGANGLEVLIAHPGGPFFRNKDLGAWTIPKGEPQPDEPLIIAARREWDEEVGLPVPEALVPLGEIRQKAGKRVHAWAFAFAGELPHDFRPRGGSFELEWPPRSGRRQSFPEIDQARLVGLDEARARLNPAQIPFLERLVAHLDGPG